MIKFGGFEKPVRRLSKYFDLSVYAITNVLTELCFILVNLEHKYLKSQPLPRTLNVHLECFAIIKDL